jgi:hypothetical protein
MASCLHFSLPLADRKSDLKYRLQATNLRRFRLWSYNFCLLDLAVVLQGLELDRDIAFE